MNHLTIVSACDRNYFWGAFLLASSVARFIPNVPLVLFQTGFTPEDERMFDQFPNVSVKELTSNDPRSMVNRKHEALLGVESEYIAWFDADCFVVGDIRKHLTPPNGEFQIRLRGAAENADVWSRHYHSGDAKGQIPVSVLKKWKNDISELEAPRFNTTCVTNCFVIHRKHLGLIRQWRDQISKVIPPTNKGAVDHSNPSYFMTDESVLTSLLTFAKDCPPCGEFMLNRDRDAHVAHFGTNPKPWKRWRKQNWYTRNYVLETLNWVEENGYCMPPPPPSLTKWHVVPSLLHMIQPELRSAVGRMVRRFRTPLTISGQA